MGSKGSKSEVIPAELPILQGPRFDWDLAPVDEAQVQGLYTRGFEAVLAIMLAIVALVRG
ncbi:MAG: hypothetical protein M1600_01240 [Firmicutes bacterium]|nr:hypothetical protein [Bacillota bacterium]